jgi:ribonuclease P protein component
VKKYAFGSHYRICRSRDFQAVFQQGIVFRTAYCNIYTGPNVYVHGRLAIIISKKTVPLSTKRHQFKRIIRESFRLHPMSVVGCDVIVMIKQSPTNKTQLWAMLESLWCKIHQWRGKYNRSKQGIKFS